MINAISSRIGKRTSKAIPENTMSCVRLSIQYLFWLRNCSFRLIFACFLPFRLSLFIVISTLIVAISAQYRPIFLQPLKPCTFCQIKRHKMHCSGISYVTVSGTCPSKMKLNSFLQNISFNDTTHQAADIFVKYVPLESARQKQVLHSACHPVLLK